MSIPEVPHTVCEGCATGADAVLGAEGRNREMARQAEHSVAPLRDPRLANTATETFVAETERLAMKGMEQIFCRLAGSTCVGASCQVERKPAFPELQ